MKVDVCKDRSYTLQLRDAYVLDEHIVDEHNVNKNEHTWTNQC